MKPSSESGIAASDHLIIGRHRILNQPRHPKHQSRTPLQVTKGRNYMNSTHRFRFAVIPRRLFYVVPVAMLVLLGLAATSQSGPPRLLDHPANAAYPLANCGRGVPAEKCNPVLDPNAAAAPPPGARPTPPAGTVSKPAPTLCGPQFFSASEMHSITAHFGLIDCLRLPRSSDWVVIGNGMSTTSMATPPAPAPGGAMLAVLSCSSAVANCLSPDSTHKFSTFTVYYPPNPSSGRLDLVKTDSSNLVDVINAYCGSYTFDVTTGSWYATTASTADSLSGAGSLPQPVKTPAALPGATALATPAPTAVTTSCQAVAG